MNNMIVSIGMSTRVPMPISPQPASVNASLPIVEPVVTDALPNTYNIAGNPSIPVIVIRIVARIFDFIIDSPL